MTGIILLICTALGFDIYCGFVRPVVSAVVSYQDKQKARRFAEKAQTIAARNAVNVGNKNARP